MQQRTLIVASLATGLLMALVGSASSLTPYPFENYSDVSDGRSAPFVGNWSVRVSGQPDRTIATCEIPLEIKATGSRSIIYRAPNDPEAEIDLIAEDRRTTWRSSVDGGGFLAVWVQPDSFYLYDQDKPDLGGPYTFTRCD